MKTMIHFAFAAALCLTAVARAAENDVRWKTASGTQFRLLPELVTASEAEEACTSRGWDVLNFEYLSDDEKAQLLASPELEHLAWGTRFAGEPGEHKVAEVWSSSVLGSYQSSLLVYKVGGESKARARVVWKGSPRRQVMCMYQGPTWMRCRQPVQCKFGLTGLQFTFVVEYGKSKPEAMSRINKRFETNLTQLGTSCALAQQEPYCDALRPRLD